MRLTDLISGLQEIEFGGVPAEDVVIREIYTVGTNQHTGVIIRTTPEIRVPICVRACLGVVLGVDRVDINNPDSPREDFSGYRWHMEGLPPTTEARLTGYSGA